uniref:Uncharacterized protein n=1 Tax=Tetranychus urticae TaxID=32264 RepID=T1KNG1_TETUR
MFVLSLYGFILSIIYLGASLDPTRMAKEGEQGGLSLAFRLLPFHRFTISLLVTGWAKLTRKIPTPRGLANKEISSSKVKSKP